MRRDAQRAGSLDMSILRTLSQRDLHGYGIVRFIRQSPDHKLLVEEGSLYPVLQRLELNGWIDGVWGVTLNNRRARIYRITAAGRKQLTAETRQYVNPTCGLNLAKRSAFFAIAFTSLAASERPAAYTPFHPKRDCDPMPHLIRDAAKDAGLPLDIVCYIGDRPRFARRAGETFAADLDRVGDMVRVVVPFGHLLLVNGTEPAVQMAVRFYDRENLKRLNASRFAGDRHTGPNTMVLDRAAEAVRALRESYAVLLRPSRQSAPGSEPRSKSSDSR